MFELDEEILKEEVYKCSKCGQCRSVCPVFLATKNEAYSPRGRFIILNNNFSGDKKIDKSFIENIDKCLYCNHCKRFCPSNIDSADIFYTLKNKFKSSLISFDFLFKLFLLKSAFANIFRKKTPSIKIYKAPKHKTVLYFQGCFNKYSISKDKNFTLQLLQNSGYKINKISKKCCGYPLLSDGKNAKFKKNIKKIEKELTPEIDYIVCSCDSCYETLKNSGSELIVSKIRRLDELIDLNNITGNENIVWFKTLLRSEDFTCEINTLDEKGLLSGGENFLFFKHPDFTQDIMKNTLEKVSNLKENIIITTCNLTNHSLKKYIENKKIMTLSEYLINRKQH